MGKNINGALLIVKTATLGSLVVGDATTPLSPNAWHKIKEIASSGSALPTGWIEKAVFETPDTTETATTPAVGDKVYPMTLETICKTECSYTFEKGTIDTTDDCDGDYNSTIVDGFTDIKGSLGGFMKIDEETEALVDASQDILNKFVDIGTDDGAGTYVHTAKNDDEVYFFICLNKDAAVGEKQNWLILPVHFVSVGGGASLKDAQKKDISWVKAPGPAQLYIRTVFAADVI